MREAALALIPAEGLCCITCYWFLDIVGDVVDAVDAGYVSNHWIVCVQLDNGCVKPTYLNRKPQAPLV